MFSFLGIILSASSTFSNHVFHRRCTEPTIGALIAVELAKTFDVPYGREQ